MKYLTNIVIGLVFLVIAVCLVNIYGNGLMGFVALMALTFMGVLILLVANHGEL